MPKSRKKATAAKKTPKAATNVSAKPDGKTTIILTMIKRAEGTLLSQLMTAFKW
jgi:hypothetical protein